jgi:hypothetical protein
LNALLHALRSHTLAVLAAAGILVAGADVAAYATDGHPIFLGHWHQESQTTTVNNAGAGPAFRFKTTPDAAPFAVSSTTRVVHLNASRLGGQRRGQLSRTYRFVIPQDTPLPAQFTATGLPPGRYHATFDAFVTTTSSPAACSLGDSRRQIAFAAESAPFPGGGLGPLSASGPVTVDKAGDARLLCFSDGTTSAPPGSGFTNVMTFTRVARVISAPATTGTQPPPPRLQRNLLGR